MSILSERELTDAERAAIADDPRPGVWLESVARVGPGRLVPVSSLAQPVHEVDVPCEWRGDGRALDQQQTDVAIVSELYAGTDEDGRALMMEFSNTIVTGTPIRRRGGDALPVGFIPHQIDGDFRCSQQRGGIHSDPLVRLLAYRAWGERDRAWRKRDTARALSGGGWNRPAVEVCRTFYGFDGLIRFDLLTGRGESVVYEANRSGRAARFEVPAPAHPNPRDFDVYREFMLDCFDELDARLATGGDPLPSGPLTFEVTA